MVNIVEVIAKHLQTNRRLVVPSLGAFVVKSSGEILFSELLKNDDGVLRALLADRGMGEIEAAGCINRFVFEVRHGLDNTATYALDDLGTLRRASSGNVVLVPKRVAPAPIVVMPEPVETPHVEESVAAAVVETPSEESEPALPRKLTVPERYRRPKRPTQRKGSDKFIVVVAVVAAVMALCAIGFAIYCQQTNPEQIEVVEEDIDALRVVPLEALGE